MRQQGRGDSKQTSLAGAERVLGTETNEAGVLKGPWRTGQGI